MAIELSEKATVVMKTMQAGADGLIGKELAAACNISSRAITGVVNSLVKKGLVERHDGNPKTIWLTDGGRAFHIPNGENTVVVKEAKPAGYSEQETEDDDVEPTDDDLDAIEHGGVSEMMEDLLDYDKADEDTQRIIDNLRQQEWEEF
jgi:predicted transcriptional regulator